MTNDAMVRAYREELDSLRLDGGAFAKAHPGMAGQLKIDPFGCSDPHVERLVESFAWLAARLRLDLDNRLPQVAQALLARLYPQLTAPLPSMAIASFRCDPDQAQAATGVRIARQSELLTEHDGQTLRFQTGADLELWPLEVQAVDLLPPSAVAAMDGQNNVAAVLKIQIKCQGRGRLEAMQPKRLRFYISGPRMSAVGLYDLLAGSLATIAICDEQKHIRRLPASALNPIGFEAQDALLPTPPEALDVFRLLLESAGFPEKFLGFELNFDTVSRLGRGHSLDLVFGLCRQSNRKLSLDASSIQLNAVPIINLFSRISEPLRINHTRNEYRIEPDSRAPNACEIHSIEEVWCRRQEASEADRLPPLFANSSDDPTACHWQSRRVARAAGSDMMISFHDRALNPNWPASDVLFARLLCTNRGLADELPGDSALGIERDLPLAGVRLLSRPTRQKPARSNGEMIWQMISQLSLNHLSLIEDRTGPSALKELLRLWGHEKSLDALKTIEARRAVRRLPGVRHVALVHGLDVVLGVDQEKLNATESSALLLGAVLSRFFGRYAAANSFVALSLEDDHNQERISAWPARAGDLALI